MTNKSPADLAREMLALLEKATPGPWRIAIPFLRNNAEAICRRLVELEEQLGDPELLASFRRQEARDQLLESASYEGSNALMREALGGLYSKLWGPDLERLGMAIDLVMAREKVALGRIAKLERVAEAAKDIRRSLPANRAWTEQEIALYRALTDLDTDLARGDGR